MAEGDVDWSGVLIIINGEMPAHCLAASASASLVADYFWLLHLHLLLFLIGSLRSKLKSCFWGVKKAGGGRKGQPDHISLGRHLVAEIPLFCWSRHWILLVWTVPKW